jgi:hypothetical protein
MWGLLPQRWQVLIIGASAVILVTAIDALVLHFTGQNAGPLRYLSLAATIFTAGIAFLVQLFWFKAAEWIPWLQTKTFPDLNGTWSGALRSTYKAPGSDAPWPPINTTVAIKQTLLTISITLQSGESKSYSHREHLEPDYRNKRFRVWYSYSNEPKAEFRHRSAPHDGVAYLEMDWDTDRNKLTGRYYNDRGSSGDLDLKRKLKPKRG